MAEDKSKNPLADDQNSNSGSNIPDWMREAGWDDDSGTFDESKPVFDDLEGEDDIVPAEIPAWLEEAAPEGFNFDADSPSPREKADSDDNLQALIEDDFLGSPTEQDFPEENNQVEETPQEAAPEDPGLDVPSWLKNLELDEDSQETAVAWLENMPESLRATDEELEASRRREPEIQAEPDGVLGWMDDLMADQSGDEDLAELSEDLVAADLIPEQGAKDKLFATEELRSFKDDAPDWLNELDGASGSQEPSLEEDILRAGGEPDFEVRESETPAEDVNLMPDWLAELGDLEDTPEPSAKAGEFEPASSTSSETDEIPDWLGDLDSAATQPEAESDSPSLAWLESLSEKQGLQEDELSTTQIAPEEALAAEEDRPARQDVSPNDDTLNTEIPDWLSRLGDEEPEISAAEPAQDDSADPASWLTELEDQPTGELKQEDPAQNSDVMEWLESRSEEPQDLPSLEDDLRKSLSEDQEEDLPAPTVLETEKYLPLEETDSLPDWLSELDGTEDQEQSLEDALKQKDRPLNEEEEDFLSHLEETKVDNADWLAKLDLEEDQVEEESPGSPIQFDEPEEELASPVSPASPERVSVSGGILDRLKDTGAISEEPEVPQWLENLKKEEDPQETAILWLKQFVERGDKVNLNDEIRRYTDELHPGDVLPKWMEDLKNEEDPQTTAMLWLEKLSGERLAAEKSQPKSEPDESDWLTALEREEAEQTQTASGQPAEDFLENGDGWLADLEIDDKIKSDAELPDWIDQQPDETGTSKAGETPSWMKATSPLEGEFHTDELAGSEKEVEIPDWLAGYTDDEISAESRDSAPQQTIPGAPEEQDEYTWVPTTDKPKTPKAPLDLNSAAISQLEGILGISYTVARGIVRYREQHGPFQSLEDLLNVPEISDEQTIEILKPEVIIKEVKTAPKTTPAKAPAKEGDPESRLTAARDLLADRKISQALSEYDYLIKKKKRLPEVIDDLNQAAADHPLDVSIIKTLGDAYMKADNLEAALKSYTKAEDLLQ